MEIVVVEKEVCEETDTFVRWYHRQSLKLIMWYKKHRTEKSVILSESRLKIMLTKYRVKYLGGQREPRGKWIWESDNGWNEKPGIKVSKKRDDNWENNNDIIVNSKTVSTLKGQVLKSTVNKFPYLPEAEENGDGID